MTLYIYDQNGYVGDLASQNGYNEMVSFIADKVPQLFDDGYHDNPAEVVKALEGVSSSNQDINATIDNLRELAKKCKGSILITDGVGIEE